MEKTKRVFNICTEEFPREKDIMVISKEVCNILKVECRGRAKDIVISGGLLDCVHTYRANGKEYYKVAGITIEGIDEIRIFIVKGIGTMIDFLVYLTEGDSIPDPINSPIAAFEKTKVSPKESGNCGQYQRLAKDSDFKKFYPNVKNVFFYYSSDLYGNKLMESGSCKSDFIEDRFCKTVGVRYIGKQNTSYEEFRTVEEVVDSINAGQKVNQIPFYTVKEKKRVPNRAFLDKKENKVYISVRVAKYNSEESKWSYNHDPGIGFAISMAYLLRYIGFSGEIIYTSTGLEKVNIPNTPSTCKLFRALQDYNVKVLLPNGTFAVLPKAVTPKGYWDYEDSSEKVCDIEAAYQLKYFYRDGITFISLNIAGTEKSYVQKKDGTFIALPGDIKIPDECFGFKEVKRADLVEGKKFDTIKAGIKKIPSYDGYIRFIRDVCGYDDYTFNVGVSVYCPFPLNSIEEVLCKVSKLDEDKIWYCKDSNGKMFFNTSCPEEIRKAFN